MGSLFPTGIKMFRCLCFGDDVAKTGPNVKEILLLNQGRPVPGRGSNHLVESFISRISPGYV